MTESEIIQLSVGILGLLMILALALSASEMHWIYPKLSGWLEKRRKKREEQRKAAAAQR